MTDITRLSRTDLLKQQFLHAEELDKRQIEGWGEYNRGRYHALRDALRIMCPKWLDEQDRISLAH